MTTLAAWSPDDEVAIRVHLGVDSTWGDLVDLYTGGRGSPQLERIVELAEHHGVTHLIIERRYIDFDWRSEHSRFYSTTFARYPSVCHRIHMFRAEVPADLGDLSALSEADYVGYAVMRPIEFSPVGRTMVRPPAELAEAAAHACHSTEEVDVLGWPFSITSVPFVSQDGQYLRCAHAAMWMVFQHLHLSMKLPRRLPFEIHDATMGGVITGRQVPSDGLSPHQMLSGMTTLGLSPGLLALPKTSTDNTAEEPFLRLEAIFCRYVNCNIPPIFISSSHAWVGVGYAWEQNGDLTLYRHDDAYGPFIRIGDPFNEPDEPHRPWVSALTPLPPKIYMSAERAELIGRWLFIAKLLPRLGPDDPLVEAAIAGELGFLTYGMRGSHYKQQLRNREGFDPVVAREYRLSNWPRNIWVVEAVDRRLRGTDRPVLGEVIIDTTAAQEPTEEDAGLLAIHGGGALIARAPDFGTVRLVSCATSSYASSER